MRLRQGISTSNKDIDVEEMVGPLCVDIEFETSGAKGGISPRVVRGNMLTFSRSITRILSKGDNVGPNASIAGRSQEGRYRHGGKSRVESRIDAGSASSIYHIHLTAADTLRCVRRTCVWKIKGERKVGKVRGDKLPSRSL